MTGVNNAGLAGLRLGMILFLVLMAGCVGAGGGARSADYDYNQAAEPFIVELDTATPTGVSEGKPDRAPQEALLRQRLGYGVVVQQDLEAYCNQVLDRVKAAWPGEPRPARCFITPDVKLAAYATPDGGIFVPFNTLRDIKTVDALAALLAHEYSHIVLEHHDVDQLEMVLTKAQQGVGLYLTLRGAGRDLQDKDTKLYFLNYIAQRAQQDALFPAYTRGQEHEADMLGLDLMVVAGYNPQGMYELLLLLEGWETRNREEEARMEREALAKLEAVYASMAQTKGAFSAMTQEFSDSLGRELSAMLGSLRREHYDAETRINDYSIYNGLHYRDKEYRPVDDETHRKVLDSPQVQDLFATIELAHAMDVEDAGWGASEAGAQALGTYGDRLPLLRMRVNQQRLKFAPRPETVAIVSEPLERGQGLYNEHMTLIEHLESREPVRAAEAMEHLYEEFDKPPMLLPRLVDIYSRLDEPMKKTAYLVQCYASLDPGLMAQCNQADR